MLGARQYNPATGAFLSIDPDFQPGDPLAMGGYAYADGGSDGSDGGGYGDYPSPVTPVGTVLLPSSDPHILQITTLFKQFYRRGINQNMWGKGPESECAAAAGGLVPLFRSVGVDEAAQIDKTGQFEV